MLCNVVCALLFHDQLHYIIHVYLKSNITRQLDVLLNTRKMNENNSIGKKCDDRLLSMAEVAPDGAPCSECGKINSPLEIFHNFNTSNRNIVSSSAFETSIQ